MLLTINILGTNVTQHFQKEHTGPLVQYFGSNFQMALKNIENEKCFMINSDSNVFFVKISTKVDNESQENR